MAWQRVGMVICALVIAFTLVTSSADARRKKKRVRKKTWRHFVIEGRKASKGEIVGEPSPRSTPH